MDFIPILFKVSSTGTPNVVITATNISGSQSTYMFLFLPWFLGPPINLTGGIFTSGTGLYASILSFVNRTTGIWFATSFTNSNCDTKDNSVDTLSTSLYLHNYLDFCIATAYHTTTSPFLTSSRLWISTTTIRIGTCVPCRLYCPLIRRFFSVHCNRISQWTLIPTINV